MHAFAQFVSPCWHDVSHFPTLHTKPWEHLIAHMPQLSGSLFAFTHVAPHLIAFPPHCRAQPPCTQTSPALHALPHAPQLSGSRFVAAQSMPHA